jgi:hypothetical protein
MREFTNMILDRHPDMPNMSTKAIGYWFNDHHPTFPKPEEHIDGSWNSIEREAVARYLDSGKIVASWRGWSRCRMCGKQNGSACLGDGVYVWPEGFSHYVRDHGVRPPDVFSKHVLEKVLSDGFKPPTREWLSEQELPQEPEIWSKVKC